MEEHIKPAASPRRYRVLIVEDQTAIRQMLKVVLDAMPDFQVAGEADELPRALRLMRRLKPDVVVLDWIFPGGGGAGILRAIQAERLHCNVLVMSAGTEKADIREALTTGAKGYVEKVANLGEFMAALRAVAGGGVYFGPAVAGIVEQMVKRPARTKSMTAPPEVPKTIVSASAVHAVPVWTTTAPEIAVGHTA